MTKATTATQPSSQPKHLQHFTPKHAKLFHQCEKATLVQLGLALGELFEHVDDALFEAAEKAESNAAQALFFDSMREIRLKRGHTERIFQQELHNSSLNFSQIRETNIVIEDDLGPSAQDMSLVNNEVYEESLLISQMASKVEGRCGESLFGLTQRMAILLNGIKVTEKQLAQAPEKVATAFRPCIAALKQSPQIQLILYRLFDQYVMVKLDSLYLEINQSLIDAKILPSLKYTPLKSKNKKAASSKPDAATDEDQQALEQREAEQHGEAAHTPAQHSTNANTPGQQSAKQNSPQAQSHNEEKHADQGAGNQTNAPQDPAMDGAVYIDEMASQELFQSINQLIRTQQSPSQPLQIPDSEFQSIHTFAPVSEGTQAYSKNDLLDALTELQHGSKDQPNTIEQLQTVNQHKRRLSDRLVEKTEEEHAIAPADADIIDLVGMLFDFILDDTELPDVCKTTLSHLHTPYLKVALCDKALFVRHQHPARRLLNSMAQAAVMWASDEQNDRGVLAKIQYTVERIINDFDGDTSLFETLIDDFNNFISLLKRQAEIIERRAVEATKGRDRLLDARNKAHEVINEYFNEEKHPVAVRHFLFTTWNDVLVFCFLRHNSDASLWKKLRTCSRDLIWSVEAKFTAPEKAQLRSKQPKLIAQIKHYLTTMAGVSEDDLKDLIKPLVQCQRVALKAKIEAELTYPAVPELEVEGVDSSAQALGSMVDIESEGNASHCINSDIAPQLIKQLKQLEFGTWFDFTEEDGSILRYKLSWFSPTTWNYMFVDAAGNRVAVKPIYTLAAQITEGSARFATITKTPIIDRALGAIQNLLQHFSTKPENPNDAPKSM